MNTVRQFNGDFFLFRLPSLRSLSRTFFRMCGGFYDLDVWLNNGINLLHSQRNNKVTQSITSE